MENKEIKLHGSDKEKAQQLLDLMKDRKLSVEELKEICPMTNSFLSALNDSLKEEIHSNKEFNESCLDTLDRMYDSLAKLLETSSLTEDNKTEILKQMQFLSEKIFEMQGKEGERSFSIKKLLISIAGILVAIVIILSGTNNKNNGKA